MEWARRCEDTCDTAWGREKEQKDNIAALYVDDFQSLIKPAVFSVGS